VPVKIHKNFDFGRMARRVPAQTAELLNDLADMLVIDIRKGVVVGRDTDNRPFKPLARSTIIAKREKGSKHPETALVDTNRMVGIGTGKGKSRGIYLSERASKGKLKAVVRTPESAPYAEYHNDGGIRGIPPRRHWFDIAPRTEKKADKLIKVAAEKIVNSAITGGG